MTNRKWTSPARAFALAVTALGALAWSGCGSSDNGQCDGYSCGGSIGTGSGNVPSDDAGVTVTTDSGPTTVDAGPTCGGEKGACACTTSAQCATGQECIAGGCTATTNTCQFSSQCPPGDVCADGRCVADCSVAGATCASGTTCEKGVCEPTPGGTPCTSGAQCSGATPVCAAGTCAPGCTSDTQCPTGDFCNQGACQTDTRPKPSNCAQATDCTGASPQACIGGYCRYVCTTNAQCSAIDTRISTCSATISNAGTGFCETSTEATPQCTAKSDCPAGSDCIGNVCK